MDKNFTSGDVIDPDDLDTILRSQPVFATPRGERTPVFLVRINSSTQELAGHDALDYQRKRWPA